MFFSLSPFTMKFSDLYKYFCFRCLKADFMESCEKISFPSFFQKNANVSIFVEIQG